MAAGAQREVIYRKDNRVDRRREELLEKNGTDNALYLAAREPASLFRAAAYGLTNDGKAFTGYPVVGFQHRIQASGACIGSPEDGLVTSCTEDPRIRGIFVYNNAFSIPLSKAPAFIADMQELRDLNPLAFCNVDFHLGMLLLYIKASSAYLGKPEDSINFDLTYYRSYTKGEPRAHSDVLEELEQMVLRKYGAIPYWGKNRNVAFDGAIDKYPKAREFLEVKDRYDPDGIFSSEWSDQVLGIKGSPIIVENGCAIEGLCICSDDTHCAPELRYFCRPGKLYKEASVCSYEPAATTTYPATSTTEEKRTIRMPGCTNQSAET